MLERRRRGVAIDLVLDRRAMAEEWTFRWLGAALAEAEALGSEAAEP